MAVRNPLYYDNGSLREMTSAQIETVIDMVIWQFAADPTVRISSFGLNTDFWTNTTLPGMPITDTRKSAGAYRSFVNRFPTEAETAEPGEVTVSFSGYQQNVKTSLTEPVNTNNRLYPLFNNGGNLQSMSTTDMYDTFIFPAIDHLASAFTGDESRQAGTYRIHTSSSLTGYSSGSIIFTDTRANTAAYTAGGIPETLDQPTTIQSYYLLKKNSGLKPDSILPVYVTSDSHIREYTDDEFNNNILRDLVGYAAVHKTGYRIRYSINGSGINRGSGMTNTILNGSGNYTTRFVNANDYRAQEFPNGTAITANTYFLRINQT